MGCQESNTQNNCSITFFIFAIFLINLIYLNEIKPKNLGKKYENKF